MNEKEDRESAIYATGYWKGIEKEKARQACIEYVKKKAKKEIDKLKTKKASEK